MYDSLMIVGGMFGIALAKRLCFFMKVIVN